MAVDELNVELNLDDEDFRKGMETAVAFIKKLDKAIGDTDDTVKRNRSVMKAWAKGVRNSLTELYSLQQLLSPIGNAIGTVTSGFIRANAEFEKTTAVLAGLGSNAGSVEEATKNLADEVQRLEELATSTPFTMEALQSSMVKLKAGGIDNLNFSMQSLIDSVARFGGGASELDRASIAIQQMAGKGVVSMEELRQQLGEAVPNAMQLMADGLNLTMGELANLVESGTLEATSALEAMFAQMALQNSGAAEDMTTTWDGTMSQIAARLNKLMRELGGGEDGLFATLKIQAQAFLNFLNQESTAEFFRELGEDLKTVVIVIANLVRDGERLNELFQNMSIIFAGIAIGKMVSGFGALVKLFTNMRGTTSTTISLFKSLSGEFGTLIKSSAILAPTVAKNSVSILATGNKAKVSAQQMGKLNSALKTWVSASGAIAAAGKIVGRAMLGLAGPAGIAVGVILELIDVFDLFGDKAEEARKKAMSAAGSINPEEYNELAKSLKGYNDELAIEESKLVALKKVVDSTAAGTSEGNRARTELARTSADIALLKQNIEQTQKALDLSANDLANNAANIFTEQYRRISQRYAREADAEYAKAKEALNNLKTNNPENLTDEELKKAIDTQRAKIENERVASIARAQRDAAKQARDLALSEVKQNSVSEEAQVARTKAINAEYDKRIQLVDEKEKEMFERVKAARETGIVTIDKADDFWTKAYEKAFVDLAGWQAKLVGSNEAYAKSVAKSTILAEDGAKHTQAEAEAIGRKVQKVRSMIAANKELISVDEQIAKQAAKIAASQNTIEDANPWLEITDAQKKYAQQIQQSISRTEEMKTLFGETSEQAKKAKEQTSQLQNLLRQQEGIDLGSSLQSMRDLTAELERQVMSESELKEVRKAEYSEQKGFIDELIADIDNISLKTGIAKDELLDMFKSYGSALDASFTKQSATAVDNLLDDWKSMSEEMDQLWANTMTGMSSALADFVMTGKLDFESLTNMILKSILQMSIQAAASNLFGDAISGFFGGGGGTAAAAATSSVQSFAKGGIAKANSPQVAVFGEGSMNEAFVPLPDGRAIPVDMNNQNTAPNVSVNVINETGTEADAEQSGMRFNGEQWVLDVVLKAMNKPGQFRTAIKGGTRQ